MSPMRKLLLLPLLAAGFGATAPAATADPSPRGVEASQGKAHAATPPAHGRAAATQTGRRPR